MHNNLKNICIYVVDDEVELLEVYKELLVGFTVRAFSSPGEFLRALSQEKQAPDIVLSDLKMPEMDGLTMIETAFQIKGSFPFILLSGHLDKVSAIDAVNLGVFRLLEKPVEESSLHSAIQQLLLEHEVGKNQTEARQIASQLRELYGTLRDLINQNFAKDLLGNTFIAKDSGGKPMAKKSLDYLLESLLENLETRLDFLLNSEKILLELRSNKKKKS